MKHEFSPQAYARIGGALYLTIIVCGLFGELYVRNTLVASGDAAATAQRILAAPTLWRLGLAGDLVMHICDVGLALVLYVLLRPVNRSVALLALLFDVVAMATFVANKTTLSLPLLFLGDAPYLKAFAPEQLQALAYVAIRMHHQGFAIGLIFFGCECIALGWLIFHSGFLPKFLGLLMPIAGLGYLANSFALLLASALADLTYAVMMPCAFAAELSLCLWLLLRGIDVPKWRERAELARA